MNFITNQLYLLQNTSLGKPHTDEDGVPTSGNNTESLQLTMLLVGSNSSQIATVEQEFWGTGNRNKDLDQRNNRAVVGWLGFMAYQPL